MNKTMQQIMSDLNEQKEMQAYIKCATLPAPEFIAVGIRQCDAAKKLEKMGLVILSPWKNQITVKLK